jgi:hypothetical protein
MDAAFHRTSSGLNNLATFLGVDAVVFLEGGDPIQSLEGLETNSVASENYDTMFWQTVFAVFRPDIKVHLRSIGSKNTVLSISRLVLTGSLRHVVTAMDRDFDHARRTKLQHPNVLYTYGYSWENDVFTKSNIKTLCRRLCLNRALHKEIDNVIEDFFAQFSRTFRIFVRWDHALACSGASVCSREALKDSIELRPPCAPRISRKKVANILCKTRLSNRKVRLSKKSQVDALRDMQGHTVERFCLGLLQYIFVNSLDVRLCKDACLRLSIGLLEKSLVGSNATARYYHAVAASVVV